MALQIGNQYQIRRKVYSSKIEIMESKLKKLHEFLNKIQSWDSISKYSSELKLNNQSNDNGKSKEKYIESTNKAMHKSIDNSKPNMSYINIQQVTSPNKKEEKIL